MSIDEKAKIFGVLADVLDERNVYTEYIKQRGREPVIKQVEAFSRSEAYKVMKKIFRAVQDKAMMDLKTCDPDDLQTIVAGQVYAGLYDALEFLVAELSRKENYVKEVDNLNRTGKNMI